MPYSSQFKIAMLDATPPLGLSLHQTNPGSGGGGEVPTTGGSPNYARKICAWSPAAAPGTKNLNIAGTPVVFDVPPSATVAFVGFWSTTTGTYYGYVAVSTENFSAQGTYTITSGTIDLMATASA